MNSEERMNFSKNASKEIVWTALNMLTTQTHVSSAPIDWNVHPERIRKNENLLISYKQITSICSNYKVCAIICITLFKVMHLLPLVLTANKYDYSLPKKATKLLGIIWKIILFCTYACVSQKPHNQKMIT